MRLQNHIRNYLENHGAKQLEAEVERLVREYRAERSANDPARSPLDEVTIDALKVALVEIAGAVGRIEGLADVHREEQSRNDRRAAAEERLRQRCRKDIEAADRDLEQARDIRGSRLQVGDHDYRPELVQRALATAIGDAIRTGKQGDTRLGDVAGFDFVLTRSRGGTYAVLLQGAGTYRIAAIDDPKHCPPLLEGIDDLIAEAREQRQVELRRLEEQRRPSGGAFRFGDLGRELGEIQTRLKLEARKGEEFDHKRVLALINRFRALELPSRETNPATLSIPATAEGGKRPERRRTSQRRPADGDHVDHRQSKPQQRDRHAHDEHADRPVVGPHTARLAGLAARQSTASPPG